ncbi:Hpt domain-containing protein [Catenovulum sp. SM1970]|uniref:Hpt domain-containing protein n=1 Tax=Marinifaba aquimaris TaxID=2741323 RepID=UPI001572C9AB|nr:Hpt domain-containing protein [Marinifaba aquimaris]NTS77129.1 Hpt domain-containing protein [Marinifaba aquimaris]
MNQISPLPVYDKEVITSLIGDDPTLIRKYQNQFFHQAKLSLRSFVSNYRSQDSGALKEGAHFLKTSAKAIGALACADLLERLEQACLNKNASLQKELLSQIQLSLKELQSVLSHESK